MCESCKKFKQPAQLHLHSMYSALDAVPTPEEWLEWALKNGCPGLAITDHGVAVSLFYAIRFRELIKKFNKDNKTQYADDAVVGIPGVELYVKLNKGDRSHAHLTCWATTTRGYFNLMKLSSLAYNDTVNYYGSIKPRVTYELVLEYSEGLRFGTGCIASPMGKAIIGGDRACAEEWYRRYVEWFGDKLYVEFHPTDLTHEFDKKTGGFYPIKPNECSCDGNMQKAYNLFLRDMVEKFGGKPIPATDAHFIYPEDKAIQDCLLKAGNDNGWYFHQSYHQKGVDEVFHALKDHLGDWLTEDRFASWIANTHEVMEEAKTIDVKFDYHLPVISIPEHITKYASDYDKQTLYLLMEKIKEHGRWRDDPVYVERFKKELAVIFNNGKLNFIPYFLMYEDICAYARSQGVFQNIARGSAGGALISYYLKIIHIDPIKNNLPFERFLSFARIRAGSFPDIDLDLSNRTPIIEYLKQKYGFGFAQIATFQKMKTKNAIKDAMWSLYGKNRNDPDVQAICSQIPDSPQGVDEYDFLYGYSDQEDNYHPGLVETNAVVANFFKAHPDIEWMVKKLIGVVRGFGRHASAFVISTTDLSAQRVPTMLMADKATGQNIVVTQYDASMVERTGLVKADILSVTTLETVRQCLSLIKSRTGKDYSVEDEFGIQEIYRLPEDSAIYTDFFNKKTDSSFQFNTLLIKGLVQDFVPLSREDLSDFTALARPGALDSPMKLKAVARVEWSDGAVEYKPAEEHEQWLKKQRATAGSRHIVSVDLIDGVDSTAAQYYVDVRQGVKKLNLIHGDLARFTSNGIFVYQEQVMAFLVEIVGYSWEEADQIRSAIAKKKHEVIMSTFERIRESCRKRGWEEEAIETVCHQVQAFSRYSFNRSHSRAYSELGYITMYLKHYHPLEWWTAVLNTVSNEDKLRHFVTIIGDLLSPPSLLYTARDFGIVGDKIVAPLTAIKGIGPNAINELMAKGPFTSLDDYLSKVAHSKVNSGHFAALVRARAVDCFMDMTKPYAVARRELLERYVMRRQCAPLAEELFDASPLKLFLEERAANQIFNKTILSSQELIAEVMSIWPGLTVTGKKAVPLRIADIPILRGLDVAVKLMQEGVTEKEVGLILLYGGSEYRHGVSKKTGKKWEMLKITLSDGVQEVEGTMWDRVLPLRFPKDCLVFVKGTLRAGYKTPVGITVSEIRRIVKE